MKSITARLYNLVVRGGEPSLDPPPRIVQAIKLGSRRGAPEADLAGTARKQQIVQLLDLIRRRRHGTVSRLMIQSGLPFLLEWEFDLVRSKSA